MSAEFLWFGEDFCGESVRAHHGSESEVVIDSLWVEEWNKDVSVGGQGWKFVEFFECREESIETEGGADAGKFLFSKEFSEVVVATAAADAADLRKFEKRCFENDSGVVIQTAGDGDVDFKAFAWDACGLDGAADRIESLDSVRCLFVFLEQRMEFRQNILVVSSDGCELKKFGDFRRVDLCSVEFFRDAFGTDFIEFVQCSEDFGGAICEFQ